MAANTAFVMPNLTRKRQIHGSEAGFPDFRRVSGRFARFRTGVAGARRWCPSARKPVERGSGSQYRICPQLHENPRRVVTSRLPRPGFEVSAWEPFAAAVETLSKKHLAHLMARPDVCGDPRARRPSNAPLQSETWRETPRAFHMRKPRRRLQVAYGGSGADGSRRQPGI